MSYIHGFAPIAAPSAALLILGSMPGKASLRARQYYAHPRNAFWSIMQAMLAFAPGLTYTQRCAQLTARRVAVWDVLKTCTRASSLDSDIDKSSIVTNDFAGFLCDHRHIKFIYFNGAAAEAMYLKHVDPALPDTIASLTLKRLPSTSPAYASLNFTQKLDQWRQIKQAIASTSR